ncbi:MAG: hypothetical protein ACOCW6_09220, partial [Spirochaetota bacterium]
MTDPKPTLEEVTTLLPGVDSAFLAELLEGLPSRYFVDFSQGAYLAHFRRLSEISDRRPYEISVEETTNRRVTVTVLARDYVGVFSILTGLLGSLGLSIKTGDVYTTGPYHSGTLSGVGGARRWYRREAGARRSKPAGPRRFIIDRFEGVRSEDTAGFAEEAERNIGYALSLLEKNEEAQARRYTIEQVVQGLRQGFAGEARETQPAQIRFDESEGGMTRVVILAEDTPFFLYTLSTALSFHDVSIEHVEIRTHRNQVEDSFEIVDSRQRKIEDEGVLNQIRL